MKLRPFFSYFGGKWTLAPHYSPPIGRALIEPFAGSAGYATRHHKHDVILVEADPVVASIWRYLISASSSEIRRLPLDPEKRHSLAPEPCALIGFWCARGRTRPATTTGSRWMTSGRWPSSFWGEVVRERVASQVEEIRHWRIIEGDYTSAPNVEATWFIDPPYLGSRHYRGRVANYGELGEWCRTRRGLVMVCEQEGATWLPFRPFRQAKSIARGSYGETIWTNERFARRAS